MRYLLLILLFAACGSPKEPKIDTPLIDSAYIVPEAVVRIDAARGPQTFYISPTGNDNNAGTFASPKFQLKKLWPLQAGDTVWCLGGSYLYTLSQYLGGANGTAAQRIFIGAFPGHKPVFTKASSYPESQQDLIYFEGNYFHFKGIEIAYFKQNPGGYHWPAFRTPGMSNNLFENVSYHDNGAGFSVRGGSTNNLFLNCDFYNNADPYSSPAYENADGIDLHFVNAGCVNTLRGCRAYWNADDGFDCWDNNGNVIFENCWSFYNGYQPGTFKVAGNGSGFKLGSSGASSSVLRTLTNNIAYKNRSYGFVENDAKCRSLLTNNTAVENGDINYWFGSWDPTVLSTFVKNISYKAPQLTRFMGKHTQTNNSWQGKTVTDADFVTMDPAGLVAARGSDGSLPALKFLQVVAGSDLTGLGYLQGGVVVPPPDDPPVVTVEAVIHYYTDKTAFVTDKPNKTLKFNIEVLSDGTIKKK